MTPHLYLVDGSAYIFRAYHRLPPLTNRHGEPAGAVYGYTAMLWKLVEALGKEEGPSHLAVVFDAPKANFRNEMYGEYKANRPPLPDDLKPQLPMVRTATRAFSLPCIEVEEVEADDVIASYAARAREAGWRVTIVSSDKDLMQIVDEQVDMLDTMNDRRMDVPYVVEKFGVPPGLVGDVLALMGDTSDNVPGVPGIGPKTASKLIVDHGGLEAVLAAAPAMKPGKLRDNLVAHADAARLSRELVTLKTDLALPQPLDDLGMKGIPDGPLRSFLEDQGFKSLLTRLDRTAPGAAPEALAPPPKVDTTPIDRSAYETVLDEAALDRWIADAYAKGFVAVDTETAELDSISAGLAGISLATAPGKACYVPVSHAGDDLLAENAPQLSEELVLAKLKPLLEDSAVLKVGHNFKYDWIVFNQRGVRVAPYDDTLLISFALDAGKHGHGMDELALLHLEHACIEFKHVCGVGAKRISFTKVPLAQATEYAAEDADVTLRLWLTLKPRLSAEQVTAVYEYVDRPLVAVVGAMETHGVKVDEGALAGLSEEFSGQIATLEGQIFEAAGGPFTIGSPKQLGEVLFDRLQLKGGRKGKSGVWSTDVTELERLAAGGAEVARLVLDWRQLSKLKVTYTDALRESMNPGTKRVHTSYSLSGAQTGRLSSTDPNLQNIPIRTEIGRRIRDAFVADEGHVILSADYSQIELRLAAHMADVPELRAAFANGDDIHSLTATELFGEATRERRAQAKTINFAILYGISRWGLAGRLGISSEEAQDMIDRYFDRFPGVRNYIATTLGQVRQTGFTTTLFGRKTHFTRINSKQMNERQGAERAAVNAPVQGTSADIIKRAMTRMVPALDAAGFGSTRMLLQVHDELVFEVPEGDAEAVQPVIREVMERAAEPLVQLSVPLGVEIGFGPNWGAAH